MTSSDAALMNICTIIFQDGEGAGDARSLLLTAGPHYYANNTSSSRNDLFVRVFMTKYIK
ncbi:hypothetical protein ALC60_07995 [Trachymyrmex zeteki]|uniref:Uncharacterized protein n=1 Tax=Mycetomoellerius zeteki TaxID=64791 RepID=A0A151WYR8_9HYME|nr:hypothetical protein ALC60_07995 [Trachymyrmex zeteki]